MNAKKKRDKNRRRSRKLADQAWDATDEGNFDLAAKIIRRAVDLDPGNALHWNDQGLILRQLNEIEQAAESFQSAISLAADYAEAYANLAEIRLRQGNVQQAVTLAREAVRHAPKIVRYREQLATYELLVGQNANHERLVPAASSGDQPQFGNEESMRAMFPKFATRVDSLSWQSVGEDLTRAGYAHIKQLLSPKQCDELRSMFHDDALYSQTVKMDKSRFGKGTYRYFRSPIPNLIDAIRQVVYPYVVQVANDWQRLLGQRENYPLAWEEFREHCKDAGQLTPTPLMLRYEAGGFNALHQDVRGEVYFPIQLVLILSPRGRLDTNDLGFVGGEFLFVDQPERKKSDRRVISAGLGDAVLFCTRSRLVKVGGVYGLRPVKHGMAKIESGTRYALGVPFHEYE